MNTFIKYKSTGWFMKTPVDISKIIKQLSLLILISCFSLNAQAAEQQLKVLASIKPLALVIEDLILEGDEVDYLIPPNASPHTYRLRPSDVVKLREAELTIWLGRGLETNFARALEPQQVDLPLIAEMSDFMTQLAEQGDHDHDEHGHEEHSDHDEHGHEEHSDHDEHGHEEHSDHDEHGHEEHSDHDGHDHGGLDPHIWLSPDLTAAAASIITARLQELNPAQSDAYQARLRAFLQNLESAEIEAEALLAGVQEAPFITLHNGFEHFVNHFDLNYQGFIYNEEGYIYSPARLVEVTSMLENGEITCAFMEPHFVQRSTEQIINDTQTRTVVLDMLAANTETGPNGYIRFISGLAATVAECLS